MTKPNFINPNLNTPIPLLDRQEILFELSEALQKYNHVKIVGPGGSGKTTLINQYLRNLEPSVYKNVTYLYGYELELDSKKLQLLQSALNDKKGSLVIIDDFESIQSPKAMEEIIQRLKEGRKYKARTIIITRVYYGQEIDINSYTINLDGRKLSKKEIDELIKSYFPNQNISKAKSDVLISVLDSLGTSPLAVRMALELLQKGDYTPEQLRSMLNHQINYKNTLIESSYSSNEIILTEPPKIITDLILVNQSILDKVSRNPKSIYEITPRQFEELVAELFEKQGYNVTLTQQTQDGGKDLLIVENRILGNFLCYVECKKYAPDNPVGVKIVRELFGTITADRATAGVIVTSSYFSEPAYTFTEKIKHQMNLIDYVELNGIIDTVTRKNNSR